MKIKQGAKQIEIPVWLLGVGLTSLPCENSVFSKPCNRKEEEYNIEHYMY
jgi:hypothetical protein